MFEFNSRHTHFPRGFGLPGRVWKRNMPLVVKDLLRSTAFLRWQEAVEVGINRGIGIPYASESCTSVLVLLSARDTPIARSAISASAPRGSASGCSPWSRAEANTVGRRCG